MKFLSFYNYLIIALCLAFCFQSCNTIDDENNNSHSELILEIQNVQELIVLKVEKALLDSNISSEEHFEMLINNDLTKIKQICSNSEIEKLGKEMIILSSQLSKFDKELNQNTECKSCDKTWFQSLTEEELEKLSQNSFYNSTIESRASPRSACDLACSEAFTNCIRNGGFLVDCMAQFYSCVAYCRYQETIYVA